MSHIDISFIIINWNTQALLTQCLRSVIETTLDLAYEIIVVDNASSDGSPEMVARDFPQVKLIRNQENVGFARANNQAIQVSCGKYILLLNSDAFMTPHAARTLFQALEDNPQAGIAGASLVYPDGHPQSSHGPLPTPRSEAASLLGLDKFRRPKPSELQSKTGFVVGACLMISRACVEQGGLLDETFFMFGEEVDLCHRMQKNGWEILHVPQAVVVHLEAGSTGRTPERVLKLYRGKAHYLYKHYGARSARQFLRVVRLSTALKVLAYRLVRYLSLGRICKDGFWKKVAIGLPDIHAG